MHQNGDRPKTESGDIRTTGETVFEACVIFFFGVCGIFADICDTLSLVCFAFLFCRTHRQHINNKVRALMSTALSDRLETAVSAILVQLTYAHLRKVGAAALTISIFIFYGCVQAARRYLATGFWDQLLGRCNAVLIGLLGNVFLEGIQVSSGSGATSWRVLLPKVAVVGCVLVFLSILLQPVRGQYNLVGICLFVFSDSLQGQIEAARDGLVVPVVAAVVCIASPLLTKELDARVPGLSVLSRALFMATVNSVLDLIQDTSGTVSVHLSMLFLMTVVMEICKSVDATLNETQAYAIYRVAAVAAGYMRRLNVETGIVAVCGGFALFVTQKLQKTWALAGLVAQILLLILVNAIVAEFRDAIAPLPATSQGLALVVLLVLFEAAKFAAQPAKVAIA